MDDRGRGAGVHAYVAAMGTYGETHWRRAGREISAAWFEAVRLAARSRLPMFEVLDEMAAAIEGFVGRVG